MKRLIDFALHHRRTVIGGVAAIIVAGLLALSRIPFDAFPDLTGIRVEVIATAPGMAPEDVEQLVTYPIESSLMGLQGAEGVRSVSKFGLSLTTVSFPDDMDIYFARTLVTQRIADAAEQMPEGASVSLGPVSTPMGELYQYTVHSDSMSLIDLKTLHDFIIRPRLRTVPGVSEVNSWGGFTEQVHVVVDPVRLAARNLTLSEVHDALERNNMTFGGSYLETGGERYTLRGLGRVETPEEIASVVVATRGGVGITVGDVATVEKGGLPRHGAVSQDGKGEVVSGMVLKLQGADSRRVIAAVKERMAEIESALPSHVTVTPFYDQTELVSRTSFTIVKNLVEGGILVIAVLFLFLRNVRASLIVASVIPLSMLIAFSGMYVFGYSANLMSLGALDFGLMVDASVVMVENFIRRLEKQEVGDRLTILRDAALEVARPVLFGIAIIVAVYIPIFTLDGMEGRMFIPMAFTVVCAVLGSLLLALTYVPAVSSIVLRHAVEDRSKMQDMLERRYRGILNWALEHVRPVVAVSATGIIVAVWSLVHIGTEFMPTLDEGAILVNTLALPSVSLADVTMLTTAAERIVMEFPEVKTVVTKGGRPDVATEAMGLFEGDMYVILEPRKTWTTAKTSEGLVAAMDSALSVLPGVEVAFTQPLAMRLDEAESGIKTDLGVKVVGPDMDQNRLVAEQVRAIIARVPGNADLHVEVSDGVGQIGMTVRREALARFGLSVADVRDAVEQAMGAQVATEIVDGPRRIGVAVRYPENQRRDAEALRGILVRAPDGAVIPLGAVVDFVTGTGAEVIGHENGQRRMLVLSNVRGRDLGSFVSEVRSLVAAELKIPAGVFLEWGGQYENQQRAMGRLRLVIPASLILIFLLLYASFHSTLQAGLVLLNVPFALVGGIAVLWLRDLNLSLSASIGFIALFGIAVLNGVVLVTHLNALREEGMELEEAVRTGSQDRLRPVLMTALVASLGFVPMALSTSPGSEVQRPLASVVIGGLITSTILTLLVLPALYRTLARWQEARAARRQKGHGSLDLGVATAGD